MKRIFAMCAITLTSLTIFAATSCAQQDKSARPSPPAKAECKLAGGKTIAIEYSSPRMKGRKIFGELVPYGKVWRAGANEATTFVTTSDLCDSKCRQVDADHQQEDRGMGHWVSGRSERFGAR
jgi:hypothetical protein